LSACGARQITEEWGELNINWHLEAFGAFYTPFWAAYGFTHYCDHQETLFLNTVGFSLLDDVTVRAREDC
jgi:hypothetical protein